MGDVTIVGGGWSVQNVAVDYLPGVVIAVNDSAIHLPHWHYAVSMDRLWAEHRWPELLKTHAADKSRRTYLRKSAVQNIAAVQNLKLDGLELPWLKVFDCDNTTNKFSEAPLTLNGTNSGACALNLAYKLRPRRLFLLGFDMNRDKRGAAYWYKPYPWSTDAGSTSDRKYSTWAQDFHIAASHFLHLGTEVFNVSPASAIDAFQKISPARFLEMQT